MLEYLKRNPGPDGWLYWFDGSWRTRAPQDIGGCTYDLSTLVKARLSVMRVLEIGELLPLSEGENE